MIPVVLPEGARATSFDRLSAFMSHSHEENAFCSRLNELVTQAGYEIWFDEAELRVGDIMPMIEQALSQCRVTIVVLSPIALQSRWVRQEIQTALQLYIEGQERIIIPVLAAQCEIPDELCFLRAFKRIQRPDGSAVGADEAAARIIEILRSYSGPADTASVKSLWMQARAWRKQGHLNIAVQTYREAIAALRDAGRSFGGSEERSGEFETYRQYLRRDSKDRITLDDSSAYVLNAEGDALRAVGEYERAIEAYHLALTRDPESGRAWLGLAICYHELRQYDHARVAYHRATVTDPVSSRAWRGRAEVEEHFRDYEKATYCYDLALTLNATPSELLTVPSPLLAPEPREFPQHSMAEMIPAPTHALAPVVYPARGSRADFPRAHSLANDAGDVTITAEHLAINVPQRPSTYLISQGNLLSRLGRWEEAIAVFSEVVSAPDQLAQGWVAKGDMHYRMEQFSAALTAYEHALEIDAGDSGAWHGKGSALRELDRPYEALVAYREALELDPGNGAIWASRGKVLARIASSDNASGALSDLRHAVQLNPELTYAWRWAYDILRATHPHGVAMKQLHEWHARPGVAVPTSVPA